MEHIDGNFMHKFNTCWPKRTLGNNYGETNVIATVSTYYDMLCMKDSEGYTS